MHMTIDPDQTKLKRHASVRAANQHLAELIEATCPASRERAVAISDLETSMVWASAAITHNPA